MQIREWSVDCERDNAVGLVGILSHEASSAQFEPQDQKLINQSPKASTPVTTSSIYAKTYLHDLKTYSEPNLQTELCLNASEFNSDVVYKSEGESIVKIDVASNETKTLSKIDKNEKSFSSQRLYLLIDKVNTRNFNQSGSSILPAGTSDINFTYEVNLTNRSSEIAKVRLIKIKKVIRLKLPHSALAKLQLNFKLTLIQPILIQSSIDNNRLSRSLLYRNVILQGRETKVLKVLIRIIAKLSPNVL